MKEAPFNIPCAAYWLSTRLGPMLAIADEEALYGLWFKESLGLEKELACLKRQNPLVEKKTGPIISIEKELQQYFEGLLVQFQTPVGMAGTPFQKRVWQELQKIPLGKTQSYAELAFHVDCPKGFRAVGNANGKNKLAIVIPCHRVVNTDGNIGGYSGGLTQKKWLLDHEKRIAHSL